MFLLQYERKTSRMGPGDKGPMHGGGHPKKLVYSEFQPEQFLSHYREALLIGSGMICQFNSPHPSEQEMTIKWYTLQSSHPEELSGWPQRGRSPSGRYWPEKTARSQLIQSRAQHLHAQEHESEAGEKENVARRTSCLRKSSVLSGIWTHEVGLPGDALQTHRPMQTIPWIFRGIFIGNER